jgi:DNA mismatch repair protein MutL
MAQVAVLSEQLINKIAAGEVVERPASVVKELVENALDAGARNIRVALAGGGLKRVSVVDDGHGMAREDAKVAMTRHATSKLRDLEGLSALSTMGFRGEALPAIASVSRFELLTCEPGAQVGTCIRVEGGGAPEVADAAPSGGTRIRVEDLFFNTPARRKFMKAEQTELRHCEDTLGRIALAHPELGFHLEHEGKSLFSSPPTADLRERIAAVMGPEVHKALLPVEERRLGLAVTGYIAHPDYTLSNARGIHTFVNRRYVRDRALNAALQRAFADVLPGGRQPVAFLFIEVDPAAVDVNVHPQKLEVRFQDVRGVADALSAAIGRALRAAAPEPAGLGLGQADAAQYQYAVDRFLARAQASPGGPFTVAEGGGAPAFGQLRPGLNEAPPGEYFSQLRFLGTLGGRLWVCEGQGGSLVVLDPHAAIERARLSGYLGALFSRQAGQQTLFSATVQVPPAEARLLSGRVEALAFLGLEVEPFGGTHFVLRAVPAGLEQADKTALLVALVPHLPDPGAPLERETLEDAIRVLACHAAGAATSSRTLTGTEREALFAELDRADFHTPARHGRIVLRQLPLLELES